MDTELNLDELEHILKYTLHIEDISDNLSQLQDISISCISLDDFLHRTLVMCDSFIPDKDFFGFHYQKNKEALFAFDKNEFLSDLSSYLLISAIVKLSYLSNLDDATSAHGLFVKNFNPINPDNSRGNFANFSKKLQEFSNSPISSIIGVKRFTKGSKGRIEYTIPNFYAHLSYEMINNWHTSPFRKESTDYRTYNKIKSHINRLQINHNNLSECYTFERLYNFSLMNKISKAVANDTLDLHYDLSIILKCFSLTSLLPNTCGRLNYIDYFIKAKHFNSIEKNKEYYKSQHNAGIIASISDRKPDQLQCEAIWLRRCEEFILQISSLSLPILENVFMFLIRKYFNSCDRALAFLLNDTKSNFIINNYQSSLKADYDLTDSEQKIFNILSPIVYNHFTSESSIKKIVHSKNLTPSNDVKTEIQNLIKKTRVEEAKDIFVTYR